MFRIILAFTCTLLLCACKNEKPQPQQAQAQPAPAQQQEVATLPSVPLELLQRIFKEGTQLDYIYHYHPFTSSMTEKTAIQNAVRHISERPAPVTLPCKPAGLLTYQIDGDIVLRADFYFEPNCTFFVFLDKENKKYGNYMTQDGVDFFNNQIQQALQLRNQMQQQ